MEHLNFLTNMIASFTFVITFLSYLSLEHIIKGVVKAVLYIIHSK